MHTKAQAYNNWGAESAAWDAQEPVSTWWGRLDADALRGYRSAVEETGEKWPGDKEFLESMQVAAAGRYTNAAVLMFMNCPEYWFSEAYIRAGFFDEDGSVLHEKRAFGPIYGQASCIMALVPDMYTHLYGGEFPFPEEAVREAIVNAVVHKDYTAHEPIQVRVSKERIRVINSGGLPAGWTMDNLSKPHAAMARNPRIASLFARAGYASGNGAGMGRMRAACEKAGLPAPRCSVSAFGFSVEFTASTGAA